MSLLEHPAPDAGPAGLKRHLTLLFADLSDSTELCEHLAPEDVFRLLAEVRALKREVITRHGGQIARLQGDGVLAVFGHPERREDDARRATEAALDLHQGLAALARTLPFQLPRPLTLHCGVHAGLTLVQRGSTEVGTLDVVGDAPNTAARLCALAERGQTVVSAETLGSDLHFFDTTPAETVQLRGRSTRLAVVTVRGRQQVLRRFDTRRRRGLAPFVGRDAELAVLQAGLAGASDGHLRTLALLGGPGMGKTRLLDELQADARQQGVEVLQGHCESYLRAEPLQPWLQVLRAACPGATVDAASATLDAMGLPEPAARALRPLLGAHVPPASEGDAAAAPLELAFKVLIDALSRRQPLLLLLDDWQWADDRSQQVLDAVLGLQAPLCVVLACRNDAAAGAQALLPRGVRRLALQPLDAEATRRALADLLPGADPLLVQRIHEDAGGVPLFLEELCHAVPHQRWPRIEGERIEGQTWLAALVESRVSRLADGPRAWVTAAAVLGNTAPRSLLEAVVGRPADDALLALLEAEDFLFPHEAPEGVDLRFKHGLTREVVYRAIVQDERRALHRRAADAIEAAGDGRAAGGWHEQLAYHHAGAGDHARAARHAVAAGDKAMASYALDQARAQYVAALQALDQLAPLSREQRLQWCGIAAKLGMTCVFDPLALTGGLALFERAVAHARETGDAAAQARAQYWMAYLLFARGRSREALAQSEAAMALARACGDERLQAQIHATLGQTLHALARYGDARQRLDEALSLKRAGVRPGSALAVGSAFALAVKGAVLGDQALFSDAEGCFAEALALLGEDQHQVGASVRTWISAVYQWQGRWEEAERAARVADRIAEQAKSRQLMAMSRALLGHAQWMQGRQPEALRLLEKATGWIEARGGGYVTSLNHGWLVQALMGLGRVDEARHHAAQLLRRARQGDHLGGPSGWRALALQAQQAGDAARCDAWLARADRAAEVRGARHEELHNAALRAELAALRGRRAEADARFDEVAAGYEQLQLSWHLGQLQARRRALA